MELTPIARAKKRLLAEMSPELQMVAIQLDKSALIAARGVLKMCYRDGEVLRAVKENPAKYGVKGLDQIAKYRGESLSTLYLNIRMVEIWSFEEIEQLCYRYTQTGKQIKKSHLYVLCEVESDARRNELMEEWFDSPMSVRELRALVGREKKKQKLGVGRKPARPVSVPAGVQQMVKQTASYSVYLQTHATDLLHDIENCPPNEFTEEVAADLRKAHELLGTLHDSFLVQEGRIREALERHKEKASAAP